MSLLFTIVAITSIWCLGLTIFTQPEMGGHKIRVWAEKWKEKGYKITEPLILCVWCLASLHSVFGYAFAFGIGLIKGWSWRLLAMWPLVICGASVVSGGTWTLITLLMKKVQYYEGLDKYNYQDPNDETVIDDQPKENYLKNVHL